MRCNFVYFPSNVSPQGATTSTLQQASALTNVVQLVEDLIVCPAGHFKGAQPESHASEEGDATSKAAAATAAEATHQSLGKKGLKQCNTVYKKGVVMVMGNRGGGLTHSTKH